MEKKVPFYLRCEDDAGNPECCMCRKCFASMKDLYGHMKGHPDHDWRDILPVNPSRYHVIVCRKHDDVT